MDAQTIVWCLVWFDGRGRGGMMERRWSEPAAVTQVEASFGFFGDGWEQTRKEGGGMKQNAHHQLIPSENLKRIERKRSEILGTFEKLFYFIRFVYDVRMMLSGRDPS